MKAELKFRHIAEPRAIDMHQLLLFAYADDVKRQILIRTKTNQKNILPILFSKYGLCLQWWMLSLLVSELTHDSLKRKSMFKIN